jgi:hypothetical protein
MASVSSLHASARADVKEHTACICRYSFVLQSLVGCVYTFGFVLMCPQLYLNYKLKSVAHLPWRQMTYKFLNTIIDDLFAFVIKMPLLHRLSVFRDDVVFFIYLYQRWVYRVDKTRVNEFGFSDKPPEEGAEQDITKPAVKGAAGQIQMLEGKPGQTTALDIAGTTQRKPKSKKVRFLFCCFSSFLSCGYTMLSGILGQTAFVSETLDSSLQ